MTDTYTYRFHGGNGLPSVTMTFTADNEMKAFRDAYNYAYRNGYGEENFDLVKWYVDYNFVASGKEKVAMNIRYFHSEKAARDFAATTADGEVGYEIPVVC